MAVDLLEVEVDVSLEEVDHDALAADAEDDVGGVHGYLFFKEVGVVVHVALQEGVAGGFGVGLFLVIAVVRIITKTDLTALLLFSYMVLFAFAAMLISSGKKSSCRWPLIRAA